jgi:mannosyltransferase
VAVAIGAVLRFAFLGAREMSPDEGASWGAASAPTIRDVIARQAIFNPGKLPIHDLMLHAWMAIFGQGLAAQRSLSAILGTLSIAIVYFVARELFADCAPESEGIDPRLLSSISALFFAVNIVMIKYAREARMYPVMLVAILLQVGFFLRALRLGGLANFAALAIFTAVGVGANFSALLVPATEALWLLYILVRERFSFVADRSRRAWQAALALTLGGFILIAKLVSAFGKTTSGTPGGIIRWIKLPAWYEPIALFNKATGTFAFPIFGILAAWGVYIAWRRGMREPVAFALLLMWAPPIMMVVVSYTLTPIFVERYALASFTPFFILAALGAVEIPMPAAWGAVTIACALALGHVFNYERKPHDAEYREAIATARNSLHAGETMTVVPIYAIEVLHYYLPDADETRAIRYDPAHSQASVIIVGDQNLHRDTADRIRLEYPVVVARFRGVVVRRKLNSP